MRTISKARLRQVYLDSTTHRMETLNALGMLTWGAFLLRGQVRHDPFTLFPSVSQMVRIMPMNHWIVFLWSTAAIQIGGLLYGVRWARGLSSFISAALMISIVWGFGSVEPRFPFVSYAFFLAVGQWMCMIHILTVTKVTALFEQRCDNKKRDQFTEKEKGD